MKTIFGLSLVLFVAATAHAQTVTLIASGNQGYNGSQQITVASNQTATVKYWAFYGQPMQAGSGNRASAGLEFEFNDGQTQLPISTNYATLGGIQNPFASSLPVITGPCTITLSAYQQINSVWQYVISTATICLSPDTNAVVSPSGVAVVPTDANGSVNVVMESSQDLLNWSPSYPGMYGAGTTNRFFRVRAIKQ